MLTRVALISLHASPLDRAGQSNAGGANVYVRELSLALARQDLQVDIFTRRADATTPDVVELGPGVRVVLVDAGPLEPLPPDDLLPFVPLFTAGVIGFAGFGLHRRDPGPDGGDGPQRRPYDVVHSHYWLSGLAALRLRRRWGVPAVHMFHTLAQVKRRVAGIWSAPDQRRALLEQEVLRGMDAIVAANALEAAQLRELYDAPHARIHAIPCGVDLGLFAPRDRVAARETLDLGPPSPLSREAEAPIVLAAARIEPLKNLETAVRATALLAGLGVPDARLVVAGGPVTGPSGAREMEHLRATAAVHSMAGHVRFVGSVTQDQLPLYMAAADAVVVPSLHESFGMVALEALACGRPVVASAAGGLQLTVHDGENGYLAPARDAPAFAARLATILSNPVLSRRMSLAARRSAEPYGWDVIADRVRCLYEAVGYQRSAANYRPSAH